MCLVISVQRLAHQQQAVAQIGQTGVDAELPGIPEGTDRSGLPGQALVPAVGHVLPVDEGLEVGAVADAAGRIDVDHLRLAAQPLLLQGLFITSRLSPATRRLVQLCRWR